jgi:cobalt-zinc-cadmium efflux system protein
MSTHHHSHGHSHDHDHDHAHGSGLRLKLALALTAGFMLVEVVGGLWSGSLALLADAGHMLTDAAALALAVWAQAQAARPADARRSYGYHRAQVLAAFVNGLALLLIAVWITIEAVQRVLAPPSIQGDLMLGVAVAGLLVNVAAFFVLQGGHEHDLNVRAAFLHVLGDMLGSAAAIVAALVILFTGWTPVDPLLSVLVALLILRTAWRLVRESTHVLLEGTPDGFDASALAQGLSSEVVGVTGVHHVHHWMLTPDRKVMTLHAVLAPGADEDAVIREINVWVKQRYQVGHVTVQAERQACTGHS